MDVKFGKMQSDRALLLGQKSQIGPSFSAKRVRLWIQEKSEKSKVNQAGPLQGGSAAVALVHVYAPLMTVLSIMSENRKIHYFSTLFILGRILLTHVQRNLRT